jgi:polyamine oxidase
MGNEFHQTVLGNPEAEDRTVHEFAKEFVLQHQLITEDERDWAPQRIRLQPS